MIQERKEWNAQELKWLSLRTCWVRFFQTVAPGLYKEWRRKDWWTAEPLSYTAPRERIATNKLNMRHQVGN